MSADKDKKRGEGGCSSCLLEEAFQDTEKKNQRIENGIVLQQSKTISVYTQGFFYHWALSLFHLHNSYIMATICRFGW
jgi:hypothetical protein